MNRKFLILFFVLITLRSLTATEGLIRVNVEGNQFVFGIPNHWHHVEPQTPFEYKLIHEDGKRECYISLGCYDEFLDYELLTEDQVVLIFALYGTEFWKKPSHTFFGVESSENSRIVSFILSDRQELVLTVSMRSHHNTTCFNHFIFVHQLGSHDFDSNMNPNFESIQKSLDISIEDFHQMLLNFEFFPSNND